MKKNIGGALLSLGLMTTPQAYASAYGDAAFSAGIIDVFLSSDSQPAKNTNLKLAPLGTAHDIEGHPVKTVHTGNLKKKVKYKVAQIVDTTYIPTTMSAIKNVKTTDCREYKNYRYYFSDTQNMIGGDNFSTLTSAQIEKILALPKCKK